MPWGRVRSADMKFIKMKKCHYLSESCALGVNDYPGLINLNIN